MIPINSGAARPERSIHDRLLATAGRFRVTLACGIRARSLLLLGALVLGPTEPASAQWAADAKLASNYVWRGRTLRDAWVAEAGAMVDLLPTGAFVTVGLSGVAELSRPSPTSIHLGNWLGRWDMWVEVAAATPTFEGAFGVVRYGFPGGQTARVMPATSPPAPDRLFNTVELYSRAEARVGWVTARGAFFVDLDKIRGTYYELGGTITIPALPELVQAVHIEAEAAFSGGQAVGTAQSPERGYFFEDGLTHVGFAVTPQVSFTSLPLEFFLTPSFHIQWNHDDATRRASLDNLDAVKVWFSVTASVYP